MKNIRGSISILLTASLMQFNFVAGVILTPGFASAAGTEEGTAPADRLQQMYDILRPARSHETISEAFYRAVPYLDEESVLEATKALDGIAGQRTPDVVLDGDSLVLKGPAGKEIRMTLAGTAKDLRFSVNGIKFTREEMANASIRMKKMKDIAEKASPAREPASTSQKHSILWPLFVPEARADIGSSFTDGGWMWGLGGLALGGIVTYMFMKNQEEKKIKKLEAAMAANQCADPTPSCCIFNGAYMPYQNGCCQMLGYGAARLSVGACPATGVPITTATAIPTASPIPVSGIPVTTTIMATKAAPRATYKTVPSAAATQNSGQH